MAASPRCFPYTIAKSAMRDTAVGIWSALELGNRGQAGMLTFGLVQTRGFENFLQLVGSQKLKNNKTETAVQSQDDEKNWHGRQSLNLIKKTENPLQDSARSCKSLQAFTGH